MATWAAWSRKASDAELVELARQRLTGGAEPWCFIEGPTRSDFIGAQDVTEDVGDAWLVRVFGASGELAARRTGFDTETPWLVRIIADKAPAGEEWERHALGPGEEHAMVLYGAYDGSGSFVEGQQFRQPFHYPGVQPPKTGDRTTLVVQVHGCEVGGPVVRWAALRGLEPHAARGRK